MARLEDRKIVKAMKEAKTPQEMVMSWGTQAPGRKIERTLDLLKLYAERNPEMIELFAHKPLTNNIDNGILDGKTRSLVHIGILMAMGSTEGIIAQVANAKGAGCTEEEIMDVAYLACYQGCKNMLVLTSKALEEAFKGTAGVKSHD